MWLRSSRRTQTMSRKRFVFSTGFIFFRNYSNTNTQMPKQMSRLRRILAPASLWNTKSACGTSSRNPTRHLQQRFYVIIIVNVINVTAIIITMMSNITKVVMIFILRWSLWSRSSLWSSPQLGWLSTRCRKSNTRFVKTVPQDHLQSIILIKNRTPRETPLTIQSLHWSRLSVSPGSPSSICSGAQNLTNYILWHFHSCEINKCSDLPAPQKSLSLWKARWMWSTCWQSFPTMSLSSLWERTRLSIMSMPNYCHMN